MNTERTKATERQSDPLRERIAGKDVLRALGIGVALALFFGLLTGFIIRPLIPGLRDVDWVATVISAEAYLALVVGHLVVFGGRRGLQTRLRLGSLSWSQFALAFAIWAAIWALLLLAYATLHKAWPPVQQMGDAVLKIGALWGRLADASPALLVVALIQPILITPVFEELLFRGSFYGWLRSRRGPGSTILITSTVFALYHPLPWLWPMALLFGLGAGWIRERTGSVTPFLVVHVINSAGMIALAYFVSGWRVS
jgi:membrane protease YdiL (CAAX protease family)